MNTLSINGNSKNHSILWFWLERLVYKKFHPTSRSQTAKLAKSKDLFDIGPIFKNQDELDQYVKAL